MALAAAGVSAMTAVTGQTHKHLGTVATEWAASAAIAKADHTKDVPLKRTGGAQRWLRTSHFDGVARPEGHRRHNGLRSVRARA